MHDYYSMSPEESLKSLHGSLKGLTSAEAAKRLKEHGLNELKKKEGHGIFSIIIGQFENFLVILLIIAAGVSALLGEFLDAAAMLSIVVLSAALGFYQEYKAERALEALKGLSAPSATAIRDGTERKVPAKELVPGDIILVEAGSLIPADARLISIASLHVDEASLTGESVPSEKTLDAFKKGTPIPDQENMVFMGTAVTYGKGMGVVSATGMRTELGKIAHSLQTTDTVKTPLQQKFEQMAKQIGLAVFVLVGLVFGAGLLQGDNSPAELLVFALSLAVAAVPSSLPAIVTISLGLGAKTLAKKNMIIKKLPAAESLGAVTIICSDKTGTITKNQMTATALYTNGQVFSVTGAGYEPTGQFLIAGTPVAASPLELSLRIGLLCTNAKLFMQDGHHRILGDPTEGALVVLGRKGGLEEEHLWNQYKFLQELPFDSERKLMSVIYKDSGSHETEAYVKGAPDILLAQCAHIYDKGKVRVLTQSERNRILAVNESFGRNALRVLALATRKLPDQKEYSIASVEKELVFVGLVGMIDPPREEVIQAVTQCKEAGIRIMVITGDHAITTQAIASHIGILEKGDKVLEGKDLDNMSDAHLASVIDDVRIIARALPIQKLRIVEALQKKGHVVAMTGDGVNDAPALKRANIGVAMGITGTDVAKEVAEATLADDNFATIVNAVREGRNIYDKVIKSTKYLLSCNAGEIMTVFLSILMGFPLPLLPLQILLMNLLTDGLPALGLGVESADRDVMSRRPRNPQEKPLSFKVLAVILLFGLIMGAGTLFLFAQYKDANLAYAQTVAFTTLVTFQMFAALGSRSLHAFAKLNPFSNMKLVLAIVSSLAMQAAVVYWGPLQAVFGTVALHPGDLLRILIVSSIGYIAMELGKLVIKARNHNNRVSV
jgi:P-type Ca2+ transporter type 2C